MNHDEIRKFLASWEPLRERTIVIVDFGNVEKWRVSLGFPVGVRELARLAKAFAYGKKPLRRFYYGADYGKSEKAVTLSAFSAQILNSADMNGFEVVEKRVKYIHSPSNTYGYEKKCDLDVEIHCCMRKTSLIDFNSDDKGKNIKVRGRPCGRPRSKSGKPVLTRKRYTKWGEWSMNS
jgi:hypothetical protein